jgi:DNA-directed RNA polymerase specialized sigma24 family protein
MRARAKGHSLQQIAKDLGIGYGTVRARLQSTSAGTYAKTALREQFLNNLAATVFTS